MTGICSHAERFPGEGRHLVDQMFMRGRCLDFASALSRHTGLPLRILDAPECGCLAHAFLVVHRSGRRDDWLVADAAGIRTVAEVIREFSESHGRLTWRRDCEPMERDPRFTPPDEVIIAIASRLPHMAPIIRSFEVVDDLDDQADHDLLLLMRAVLAGTTANAQVAPDERWRPAMDLLSTFAERPAMAAAFAPCP